MAYTKVHTEGIVIKAHDVGEADRLFGIFTRDLGLVYARARGVRNLRSLQRPALQPLSLVDISFVRSKAGWRITNVASARSFFTETADDKAKRRFITRILTLLRRLVTGEETNRELFATVRVSFDFLLRETLSADELQTLEVLTVLRMFSFLGYLKQKDEWADLLKDTATLSRELLAGLKPHRRHAVAEINKALHETQL